MSLGPDARSLLNAASDGDEPSEADMARVRSKLAARLALGAAAGATAVTATKTATAATLPMTSLLGLKIGAAVLLLAAAGATAAVVTRDAARAPVVPTMAKSLVTKAAPQDTREAATNGMAKVAPDDGERTATPPVTASTPSSVTVPPSTATAASIRDDSTRTPAAATSVPSRGVTIQAPAATASATSVRPPAAVTAATAARGDSVVGNDAPSSDTGAPHAAAVAPPDSVAEEASLLRAANGALARNDGKTALARVDEHAARFPGGALTEEREATRVFALCAVGRVVDSRAAAASFVASRPRSPLAARVRRTCTTAP